jgi:hypothetical protein
MTPLLLAPLGLAALAALIAPLLIHLRRRTEEVPLDFAAMRWLEPRPRPRRRLRFDEWLLLALRILLILLLALLLARPAVLGWEDESPRFLAAPGVAPEDARTIAGPEADIRWIAPGFPGVAIAPPANTAQTSSLIRQFDAELPPGAPLTILVPPVLKGVDAERLHLTRQVRWRIVAGDDRADQAAAPASPILSVRGPQGEDSSVRYFRAAAGAWNDKPRFDAGTEPALPPREHVLIWLFPGPVPQAVTDWIGKGGTAVLGSAAEVAMPAVSEALWTDEAGRALIEGGRLGSGRIMRFTRPLVPAAMPVLLAPDFAANLRDLVAPPAPPPARVDAAAFAPTAQATPYALPPRELSSWLGVLIALVFAAERLLATRRRRFAE